MKRSFLTCNSRNRAVRMRHLRRRLSLDNGVARIRFIKLLPPSDGPAVGAALPGPEPKPGRYYSDYEDAKWDSCLRCGHFRAVDQQFCADCLDKFGPPCDHCGLLFVEGGYRSQSGTTNFCDACLNILDTADRPGGAA